MVAVFLCNVLQLELLFLPREESRRAFSVLVKKCNCSVVALLFSPLLSSSLLLYVTTTLTPSLMDHSLNVLCPLYYRQSPHLQICQNQNLPWLRRFGPLSVVSPSLLITALDFQYLNFSISIRLPTSVIFTFEMEFYLKIPNRSPSAH